MMTSPDGFDERKADVALFDTWLRTRLQRLYDEAFDEAVPDDLLRLLPEPGKRLGH